MERGHGFKSRWSPDFFFQASSFQLLKLENLLRWSFFTFIYNRSSKMNYFIYTSHQRIQGCFDIKKNALTVALSLVCLDIRSRNEEAINSTRNRIYSLKVFTPYFWIFTFYLFLNWLSTTVTDDRKYVCGRRLYACVNARTFKGLDSKEIT